MRAFLKRASLGFTLIELLVVIAIIAILASPWQRKRVRPLGCLHQQPSPTWNGFLPLRGG
jgi:prepilin-type N-terminal cleavage/methylation domain-containing protein